MTDDLIKYVEDIQASQSHSDDVDTLARTLYGEARGEGDIGLQAVANVVMNRCVVAKKFMSKHNRPHPLFGDGTAASACKEPCQFSCWNDTPDNVNLVRMKEVTTADPIFTTCVNIATLAVEGVLEDKTDGATYYYATSMARPPRWAATLTPCVEIGHHLFFNNVP